MKRKDFIRASLVASAGLSLPMSAFVNLKKSQESNKDPEPVKMPDQEKMKICIFSKQLQWLNYQDMAYSVAEMGYDGIDLTVRADGHVVPDNVERDLPKAVEAASRAGIKILMISTDISDANDAKTERILKIAADLNIHYYRTNGLNYQKALDIPANLEIIRKKFSGLAEINKKHGVHSDYLNHSGDGFGSSIWDLWLTLKELDPRYIGSQYDIKHATIAGAFSWPVNLKLIHKYVETMVIRDFRWEKNADTWEIKPVPIGEGMVDFKKYFGLVKEYQIKGPISLMCDYDLGGAENGARSLKIPKSDVLKAMKKDLFALKNYLKSADL